MRALLFAVQLINCPPSVRQSEVDALWAYVQEIGAPRDVEPSVYFAEEDEPKPSMPFLAFYYGQTNIVRVSQSAWHSASLPPRPEGFVYLVLGHEMLHYALAREVPIREHHCLFERRSYQLRLADYLIGRGVAHPVLRLVPLPEGCE